MVSDRDFWIHDVTSTEYEVYCTHGFCGTISIHFWTASPCYRVSCDVHGSKCHKLVSIKGRTTKDMIDLCGQWLSQAHVQSKGGHFDSRPA